jgi:hypothetical protein
MAFVLAPRYAKSYNFNPRGSATATVRIAGRNPFEGGVPVRMKAPTTFLPLGGFRDNMPFGNLAEGAPTAASGSAASWWGKPNQLAGGMGGLGDDASAPSSPSWLDQLVSGVTAIAVPSVNALVGARINTLYGTPATAVPTTNAVPLPTSTIAQLPVGSQMPAAYMQQATSSKLPIILVGAGVVGLLAVYMMTRKKR